MGQTITAVSSLANVETVGNIGIITLKNPAKRNALCNEMMHALSEAFARFAEANPRRDLAGGARRQGMVRWP